jgi:hypothetical protein
MQESIILSTVYLLVQVRRLLLEYRTKQQQESKVVQLILGGVHLESRPGPPLS